MSPYTPAVYTLKECCSILKIGRNKMLELIWDEEIEAFKIGGHWRITENALQNYLKYPCRKEGVAKSSN